MSETAPKRGEFLEGKLWFQRRGITVTVGMTNAAIEDLGEVETVEFPDEGEDFDKGEVIVTVEGTHGKLEITTPAAGVVQEVNAAAVDEPDILSEDPLEEGWLVKLEIQDSSDLKEFGSLKAP